MEERRISLRELRYTGAMRIVSYNVLADGFIRSEYYPRVDPRHLDPHWRRPRLLDRLTSLEADVICLQEVEDSLFVELQARLADTAGHYAQRLGGNRRGARPSCATFVRGRVVDHRVLTYSDGSGAVALLTEVEVGDLRMGVANTHLRWGTEGTRVGLDQAVELLDALPQGPWVACGDFNAPPESELVAEFRRRGFGDAYADIGGATCNANGSAKRIDFLMYRDLECVAEPIRAIDGVTPLPSADEPSDHLAVCATFYQRTPEKTIASSASK
jgi:endonuclease/exonuclease/phosphatase family metal-dependent hydrolase